MIVMFIYVVSHIQLLNLEILQFQVCTGALDEFDRANEVS